MAKPCVVLFLVVTTAFQATAQNPASETGASGAATRLAGSSAESADAGALATKPTTGDRTHVRATTKVAVFLDVLRDGKRIGSTKIPAGRQVSVIEELGVRIRVAAGSLVSGWVSGNDLQIEQEAEVPPALQENASAIDRRALVPQPPPSVPPVDVSRELDVIRVLHGMPGISALAVKNGRIVAQGAAGYRRMGDPTPLLVTDPINIGSCTKWMTASVAGRLVDRGIIKWTTRVRDSFENFSDFSAAFHDATLEQILAHRAGLQDGENFWKRHKVAIMKEGGPNRRIRQWASEAVLRDEPAVKPGAFHYSVGYGVAATMMELATGKDWETLVREEVFEPARIKTGSFAPVYDGELPPKAPVGHDLLAGQSTPEPRPPKEDAFQLRIGAAGGPGGSVACTLQGWAKFLYIMATLDQGNYLTSETASKLCRPYAADKEYGLGVRVYDRSWATPGPALHHGGSTAGLDSLFWVAPAHDLVIVAFANCYAREGTLGEGRASGEALQKVAGLLIKQFAQKPPAGPTLELPLVLSLGANARHNVFAPDLSLKEMRAVW